MNTSRILTPDEVAETELAQTLHRQLAAVNPLDLPVLSRERCLPRKQQAKLARQLMKQLGFKGISVTTPSYSMASTVDLRLPKRRDHLLDAGGFMVPGCEASVANRRAHDSMLALLLAAFPNHDDRSESISDYFDYCWSVD